jgi:hypothetical protein
LTSLEFRKICADRLRGTIGVPDTAYDRDADRPSREHARDTLRRDASDPNEIGTVRGRPQRRQERQASRV